MYFFISNKGLFGSVIRCFQRRVIRKIELKTQRPTKQLNNSFEIIKNKIMEEAIEQIEKMNKRYFFEKIKLRE